VPVGETEKMSSRRSVRYAASYRPSPGSGDTRAPTS
jgi:hypothetical protein